MTEKKSMTTTRWIIVAIMLIVVLGIFIAMLASGHQPSLHFIGSIVFVFFFVGFVIWANLGKKKADRALVELKAQAGDMASKRDFAGAICIWKQMLPHVGEEHVKELLPQLEKAYQEMGSSGGKTRLSELEKMYDDLFDMAKRSEQLDAKGRAIRQSLADKICEAVSKLPESSEN